MRAEPAGRWLLRLAALALPWAAICAGRRVCLTAQRVPLLVLLVRRVVTLQEQRRHRHL